MNVREVWRSDVDKAPPTGFVVPAVDFLRSNDSGPVAARSSVTELAVSLAEIALGDASETDLT